MPLAASARITGRYSGRAPAMTALTATFSTVNSQNSRNAVGRSRPTTSSGGWLVPLSIASTRASVGRTIGRKSVQWFSSNSRCRLSSVSGSSSRGVVRSNDSPCRSASSSGARQPLDHLLHERPAVNGIVALDVGAQLGRRAADHRLRHERLPRCVGMPFDVRDRPREPREDVGCAPRRSGRRPASSAIASPTTVGLQVLQSPTPRMAASPSGCDPARASPGRRPSSRAAGSCGRLDRRQVLGEPVPELLDEDVGVVEQAVDEVDALPVEALEPRRERLAGDLSADIHADRGR